MYSNLFKMEVTLSWTRKKDVGVWSGAALNFNEICVSPMKTEHDTREKSSQGASSRAIVWMYKKEKS